jgi:hypothetical protein
MPIYFRTLRLLALSFVLTAIPALAQFEVSPDHFDSPNQKTTKHQNKASNRTVRKPTRAQAASKTATRQGTHAKSKSQSKSGSASTKSKNPTT